MKSRYFAGERIWFAIAIPKRWWSKFDWWISNYFLHLVVEGDKKPDKMKTRFCPEECAFLFPIEKEQSKHKEPHHCFQYDKHLRHGQYHPQIVSCKECIVDSVATEKKQ